MIVKEFVVKCLRFVYRKWKKIKKETKRNLLITLVVFCAGALGGAILGGYCKEKKTQEALEREVTLVKEEKEKVITFLEDKISKMTQAAEQEDEILLLEDLPWNLTLVNKDHPMVERYVPVLEEIQEGYSVDIRIVKELSKMLQDAKKAGMDIVFCSAYRSVERQQQVFNDSVTERLYQGMDYWEAYESTSLSVLPPGCSEHALGLAVDLVSADYQELDEGQAITKEAKWLEENCYKYGFILRYPVEKTDITGIIYEPWHYRYVGKKVAKEIMSAGITFEEYLQDYE